MAKFCLTKPFFNFIINSFKGFLKESRNPKRGKSFFSELPLRRDPCFVQPVGKR